MSFQLSQTDARASTTAGFTRTGRRSERAANTSAAALTVQSAALRCATTSCRRPLTPARTHIWPGFRDSVVSVWTATGAHGVSRLSSRFSLHLFWNYDKGLTTSGQWLDPRQRTRWNWKAKPRQNFTTDPVSLHRRLHRGSSPGLRSSRQKMVWTVTSQKWNLAGKASVVINICHVRHAGCWIFLTRRKKSNCSAAVDWWGI